MNRLFRWIVVWTVTIIVCIAVTWATGAEVLTKLMSSPDSRWVVASGLGVTAGALAALWGVGFATRETSAPAVGDNAVIASGIRSIAVGGDISGTASTGGRQVGPRRRAEHRDGAFHRAGSGHVAASGPNSIAVGGDLSGSASTGDDVEKSGG
jgi:hypothetical protein